jgi:ATP-dependent exoDNAse (exonuclease V) alpha subunit
MIKHTLPTKHLSARVPWHDNKWNGTICCNVLDNSFCRILPKIDSDKDEADEEDNSIITDSNHPPCLTEKGTFLSPNEYSRKLVHAWVKINPLFKDFKPAVYHHKPYSFNAVPFYWMMKGKSSDDTPHFSEKASIYELDYKTELEDQVDRKLGFDGNIWVQHPKNQKVLLDSFFGCLKKKKSLIFFYAKHTPLSETNERVIVGVAKVNNEISNIIDHNYPSGHQGHKSYAWDRCIEHSLNNTKESEGFLMPYHEILEAYKNEDLSIELNDYAAIAPDFLQFSYASELVEHDTAIDSLLIMAEKLRKSSLVLENNFTDELEWIDNEISQIWDMRGAFPGMGAVLTALGIRNGNSIAWAIEKHIIEEYKDLLLKNPWEVFENHLNGSDTIKKLNDIVDSTAVKIFRTLPKEKKRFLKNFSKFFINNNQADYILKNLKNFGGAKTVLSNFYLLYEKSRFHNDGISFRQIEKALLAPDKILNAFPLEEDVALEDRLDLRRLRALSIWILEEASNEGHSLLPFDDLLNRIQNKSLEQEFPIQEDLLKGSLQSEFCEEELQLQETEAIDFVKLKRLNVVKRVLKGRLHLGRIKGSSYDLEKDWLQLINEGIKNSTISAGKEYVEKIAGEDGYEEELKARKEKAEALRVISNYKLSVLIGPAGSGKTTLLQTFEQLPEIQRGGIIKLAPTGKARVNLGADGKTVAQFLYPYRYDGATGRYFPNPDAPKIAGAKNIIIDEASMLTEEQLAAIFDSLGVVDRIILVGDYRQLPPIGTGRPFVDIVKALKPDEFEDSEIKVGPAYAQLQQIMRQAAGSDRRWDVELSACFGDNLNKEQLEVFSQIASSKINSKHIRLEKWYESKDFQKTFNEVLIEELQLDKEDLSKSFNRKIGAEDFGNFQYFNAGHAEKVIEDWQIISPVNGYGFGVKEVNKNIQTTYRKPFIELAHNSQTEGKWSKRQIAKPKGNDNIVYGDKVINLQNAKWQDWQWIKPMDKKEGALKYIANGEIGSIVGEFRGRKSKSKGEPNIEIAFSTQKGYSYVFKPWELGENGQYSIDLAYAITVHKSQGSGFKTVFFILPSKGPILSKELLYTALTRQEDKIVIFHQGDFNDYIRLASTEASATARRFTDLFELPTVKEINKKYYDANYINISERGEPMISKNEVIIANCLNKYKDRISYAYEDKLKIESTGRTIKPDFTVQNLETGREFYWEHIGMMTKTDYREKWEKKLIGYLEDGFVLHTNATWENDKVLIVTEENPNGGINSQAINKLVKQTILEEE